MATHSVGLLNRELIYQEQFPVIEKQIEMLQLQLTAKVDLLNQELDRLKDLDSRITELSAIYMADIADYIESFYNQKRRHSTFDNISPVKYEAEQQNVKHASN